MSSGAELPVTFVLIDREPFEQLRRLDPDRDWNTFVTGERNWILQSYLRLRAAGAPVALSSVLPADGVAVFSSKQRRLIRSLDSSRTSAVLVGVRQDVGEALIADFEVVQNRHQADDRRRFFIPHWPQPGLLPRDHDRGTRVETIAYMGFSGNLHPDLRGEAWRAALEAHGLRWMANAVPFVQDAVDASALTWNDYRGVDVVVALRPPDRRLHRRKPATKLYNAWLAGVPALLGPELAYRELRRSELDYIEIGSRADAEAAILHLQREPELYRAMVESGRQRAAEFGIEAITERWRRFLFELLPAQADAPHVRRWRGRSLRMKELARRLARAVSSGDR